MIYDRRLCGELAYYYARLMARPVERWIAGERFPPAIFY